MKTIKHIGWKIDMSIPFEVGETCIVRATSYDDNFWASLLITVLDIDNQDGMKIKVETVLDGSPGIVDAYFNGNRE